MRSSKPLVSVITVTLNSGDFFAATVESVKDQDYENIEFIVIDGGSSDETKEYLFSYSDIISNQISEPDMGIYDAMNKGVRLCSVDSEFVVFMNAGDVFCNKHTLSKVMEHVGTGLYHLYGDVLRNNCRVGSVKKVNFYALSTNMICHQAILFKTAALRVNAYDAKYKLCSDYKLLIELIKAGDQFRYVDMPIAKFNGTGISSIQRDLLRSEKKEIRSQYPILRFWHIIKTRANFYKC